MEYRHDHSDSENMSGGEDGGDGEGGEDGHPHGHVVHHHHHMDEGNLSECAIELSSERNSDAEDI